MRNVLIFVVVCVAGLATWIAVASWQWGRLDTQAVFRARIASEAPAGSTVTVLPGTLVMGDLGGGARLVCGSVSLGSVQKQLYSLVLVKTLFGYAINDGFTPAARPQNQPMSERNCAALYAHEAAHPDAGTH